MLARVGDEVALVRRGGGKLAGKNVRVDPAAVPELVRVGPGAAQLVEPVRPLRAADGRMLPCDQKRQVAELAEIADDGVRGADPAHLAGVAVDLVDRPSLAPG